MGVKLGYKQTEVGIIPKDWDIKKLSDLGDVVRGASPRPAGDSRYFNGDFIPWLTVAALTNISVYQSTVLETVSNLTEAGSKHSRTLSEGTLIIANSGATLGVAKLLGVTCCANDGIAAIINQRYGNKLFVCYYINTLTKRLREVVATGNGQPNLNTGLIRQISIPFPPPPEQHAIAEALSDVDNLINSIDELITKKRNIKQATMQQLLTGKRRLPGFTGEWQTYNFGKVFSFLQSANYPREDLTEHGEVEYIHYGDIHKQSSAFLDCRIAKLPHITFAKASKLPLLEEGDLVMVDASEDYEGIGKSIEVKQLGNHKIVAGLHTFLLRADKSFLTNGFIGYLQYIPSVRNALIRFATGISVYGVSKNNVKLIQIEIPKRDEQIAISTVLSDMDAEITALEARREKTRLLKQGVMQELLTGRIRLV